MSDDPTEIIHVKLLEFSQLKQGQAESTGQQQAVQNSFEGPIRKSPQMCLLRFVEQVMVPKCSRSTVLQLISSEIDGGFGCTQLGVPRCLAPRVRSVW